jgi:hypothetical protein
VDLATLRDYAIVGVVGRGIEAGVRESVRYLIWRKLGGLLEKVYHMWTAPNHQSRIFDPYNQPPTSIVYGWRHDIPKTPDPEDFWSVSYFHWSMARQFYYDEERAKRNSELRENPLDFDFDKDENIFSIGGPRSSSYSKPVGYFVRTDIVKPKLPIYFEIDEQWEKNNPGDYVHRKYDSKWMCSGMWKIHVEEKYRNQLNDSEILFDDYGKLLPGRYHSKMNDDDGRQIRPLEYDYLLLTMMPNPKNVNKVYCIISGMYGPGVMAFQLLLDNKNGALRDMDQNRKGSLWFQSLFKIHRVEHGSGIFDYEGKMYSKGNDIELLITIPLQPEHYK